MRALFNGYRDDVDVVQNFDYATRTDGQPVYFGWNDINAAEGDVTWSIFKYTYNVANQVTKIESKRGSWTGRVALFA
jgi:hypothetical protein